MYDYDWYINALDYDLDQAYSSAVSAHWSVQNARTYYNDNDDHRALGALVSAAENWDMVFDRMLYGWSKRGGWWREKVLAEAIRDDFIELCNGGEYELTLIKMIEAYLDAPDDARSAQRLLFDAYKSSMYDKPFDKEYHALWIQRFRSWT